MSVWRSGWFIRKAMYTVASVVFLILAGFGVITESQSSTMLEQLNSTIVPFLATMIAGFAAAKTNSGSDSTVTVADVIAARNGPPKQSTADTSMSDYIASVRGE